MIKRIHPVVGKAPPITSTLEAVQQVVVRYYEQINWHFFLQQTQNFNRLLLYAIKLRVSEVLLMKERQDLQQSQVSVGLFSCRDARSM